MLPQTHPRQRPSGHFISPITIPSITKSYTKPTSLSKDSVSQALQDRLLVFVFLIVWYVASVVGTIMNKEIVKSFQYPIALTSIHLASGYFLDLLLLRHKQLPTSIHLSMFVACIPVGLMLSLGKMLTYISYGKIPVSLTHTVKSSSPIFSAIISLYIFKKHVDSYVYFSLLVIAIGVTLSAITELEFQILGFLAAVFATLTGVLHSALLKRTMQHFQDADTLQLHYHTTVTAVLLLLPFTLFMEGRDIVLSIMERESPFHFPYGLFLASILSQYIQTIMSTFVLSNVTVISHQVSNTLKRLIVIVCSVWWFQNSVSISNAIGMLLALGGFLLYGLSMLNISGRQMIATETPPLRVRTGNSSCDWLCQKLFPYKVYSLPTFSFNTNQTL